MECFQYNWNIDFSKLGITKADIENLLPHWKSKINEVYQYKTNNLIEIDFLVAANSKSEVQQWIHDYEEKSKCTYSIRSTDNCTGKRVVFKQKLKCHHNTGNTNMYEPSNPKRTRNTNCPSTITVTLKTVHKRFQGKDKSKAPDPSMPCEIRIVPYHNHSISSADALRFRQVSDETREKLISLFESGYSPANALETIKMDIQVKNENFLERLADRSICPDYMYCYHLYMKIITQKNGPLEASLDFLEKKVDEFNKSFKTNSAMIKYIDDKDYVIWYVITYFSGSYIGITGKKFFSLCPPLMQRVHDTVQESSNIVFMDSTGTVDHRGHRIFVLLTASNCGGLPLAIFITTSECVHSISVGFQLLKEIMGSRIFYGNVDGPNLFMTDDSAAEHAAIRSEWPKSTNLLCIFHVLKSVWRWLMKTKNGIKKEHQNSLFQEFRSIMYANNEEECKAAFHIALIGAEKYPEYQSYLNKYWDRNNLWALCYRNHSRQGHNTNNLSEAAMRLLKEKIFERIKAFNLIQVIDFMMTTFIFYYEKRLLDAAYNRTRKNILYRMISLPPSADIIKHIQHLTDSIHLVPSERDSNLLYIVNTEVLSCSCKQGRTGSMCKHIDWICCFVKSDEFIKKVDNESTRAQFFFIATGNQPPRNWLEHLYSCSGSSETIIKNTTDFSVEMEINMKPSSIDILEETNEEKKMCESNKEQEMMSLSKGNNTINGINDILSEHLNRSPLEISKALEVFYDGLKSIKTTSRFATVCNTFSSAIMKQRKNRIDKSNFSSTYRYIQAKNNKYIRKKK